MNIVSASLNRCKRQAIKGLVGCFVVLALGICVAVLAPLGLYMYMGVTVAALGLYGGWIRANVLMDPEKFQIKIAAYNYIKFDRENIEVCSYGNKTKIEIESIRKIFLSYPVLYVIRNGFRFDNKIRLSYLEEDDILAVVRHCEDQLGRA